MLTDTGVPVGRAGVAAVLKNQHLLRFGMGGERRMDEVLVVDELLALRGHEAIIQTEQLAELRRVMDFQRLEGGFRALDEFG